MARFKLLTENKGQPKLAKDKGTRYLTVGLHLAPARNSGFETCEHASPGCRKACLYRSGRGNCTPVQNARKRKTRLLFEDKQAFYTLLVEDIRRHRNYAHNHGKIPAVRLNCTSDIRWEKVLPSLFTEFQDVQFYDYTKDHERLAFDHPLPTNYHLTYSRSEDNEAIALELLAGGRANVAVVFSGELPDTWKGYPVYDGTKDDLRFADPMPSCLTGGNVCGLVALGRARKDDSGFVVRPLCEATPESEAFDAMFTN